MAETGRSDRQAPKGWVELRARYRAIGGEIWRGHPDDAPFIYAVNWNACDWVLANISQARKLIAILEVDHQKNLAREAEFWARENRGRPKAERVPLDAAGLPLRRVGRG
ncbi:MAG: hypothetical protein EOO27_33055 [Comamonadaceae bacterium]|nr:MAG: hypothetical protein EOO27_33055 [Comamonadaceae bacterium]